MAAGLSQGVRKGHCPVGGAVLGASNPSDSAGVEGKPTWERGGEGGCLRREYLRKGKLLSGFFTFFGRDGRAVQGGVPMTAKGKSPRRRGKLSLRTVRGADRRGASFSV